MSHLNLARTQVQNINQLKQFHAQIIHHALHGHNYWITILLGHCARLRAPHSYARKVFDTSSDPNQHVFTTMLKFYSQMGAHEAAAAASLFVRIRELDVRPDAFVFPVVLKSVEGLDVKLVHAYVVKLGCEGDRYVRNAIVDAYAKRGRVETARRLFDEIPNKVVVDWNAMVSAYWRCGDEVAARKMFDEMPEHNVVSWTAMVSGYIKLKEFEKARWFFDSIPEKNVVTWNAMLSGYVQNGLVEEALGLFEEMTDAGVSPDETTLVTVVSACSLKADLKLAESFVGALQRRKVLLNCFVKTAMIDMYAKCGDLARARRIFDGMDDRNTVSWNTMISGHARDGNLEIARELFDKMPAKNVVSWNSMISGYVQNGQWFSAIELFKVMVDENNINPDEVTMVSVISACGHLGALETGKWLSGFLDEKEIKPTISVHNALVFMYSRCGKMDLANKVFTEMPSRNIFSYNSLINGLATQGNATEALKLLNRMNDEGIEPDRITFISMLTACSHAGLLTEGRRVFTNIKNPTVDHYACVIDLLGRAAQLDEAKKMIDEMPMEPHAGVYGSLLNASRIHKRIDLGEFAAQKLFALEPENSGNYILLANIYASANRWEEVERIRELMRERGVSKTTGCSWIEFSGKVLRFIAGDQSHDQSEDMYRILNAIGKKMRSLGYVADKSCVLRDVEEEEKEEMIGAHSEKLAVAFGILTMEATTVIRVVKNLRICGDCHNFMKMVSKLEGREIVVRDNNRFHCFRDGECTCKDYW